MRFPSFCRIFPEQHLARRLSLLTSQTNPVQHSAILQQPGDLCDAALANCGRKPPLVAQHSLTDTLQVMPDPSGAESWKADKKDAGHNSIHVGCTRYRAICGTAKVSTTSGFRTSDLGQATRRGHYPLPDFAHTHTAQSTGKDRGTQSQNSAKQLAR
ncbi:hypothetical protein BS50DRAFT_409073 [Corynespora cassiicola Philippines]|uniref:Uncharacterized protein n=1 Tax=Corynespora cassiicola Philippines TaxID=1448308 RepID=A0A2T2NL50_CORCC|nr:hypothetical protein BS50DRAFT_409073 [Corynespora cassiicola Philippines]